MKRVKILYKSLLFETKFSNEPLPIKGYKWFYKNRKNREGGGVAIAARKDLLKSTTEVENLEDQNQEVLWVQLKSFHETTFVGVYYGKQETDKREEVQTEYSQLQAQVHKLEQIGEVILQGDHNAKLLHFIDARDGDLHRLHLDYRTLTGGGCNL